MTVLSTSWRVAAFFTILVASIGFGIWALWTFLFEGGPTVTATQRDNRSVPASSQPVAGEPVSSNPAPPVDETSGPMHAVDQTLAHHEEQWPPPKGCPHDKNDFPKLVKRNAPKVFPCLKSARAKGELVPGKYTLTLDWVIHPDGHVTDGRLTGPAALLKTSLAECVASALGEWKFPPSQESTPVRNYPFGPFTVK